MFIKWNFKVNSWQKFKENPSSKTKFNRNFIKLRNFLYVDLFLGKFRVQILLLLVNHITLLISLYFIFVYLLLVIIFYLFFMWKSIWIFIKWNFKPNTWQNVKENLSSKRKFNRNFIKLWNFLEVDIFLGILESDVFTFS